MLLIAFEGSPDWSTTSTLTIPESALGKKTLGDVKTASLDGYPLGITVETGVGERDSNPSDEAVIVAAPGVLVVVTFAIT
jgi:hypothetical protein